MKKSVLIALVVAVAAVGWVLSGTVLPPDHGQTPKTAQDTAPDAKPEQKISKVRVRDSVATPFNTRVTVTGKTQAYRSVDLKAEVDGQIVALLVDKGAKVKTGDVIARIDPKDRAARVQEARQLVNQRAIEYNAAQSLEKEGFYSKTRLAQAAADQDAARAGLKLAELNLDKTNIRAPFDGVVGNRMVNIGDYMTVGTALFTVVDLDPLKLTGFVSEKVVMDLTTGTEVDGKLLNGQTVKGVLSFIAPVADAATRTFPVEVTLPNPEGKVFEGLTAEISIPTTERPGHRISPSILTLNDKGQVGVKVVTADNTVEFIAVVILSDEADGTWVGGLPDTIRLITVGQDYVIPGQTVDPVPSTDKDGLL